MDAWHVQGKDKAPLGGEGTHCVREGREGACSLLSICQEEEIRSLLFWAESSTKDQHLLTTALEFS